MGDRRRRDDAARHVAGRDLSAFLDDELDDEAALELTHHVHACTSCRAELEAIRETRSALRRLPALQAPVLTAEVRSLRATRSWSRRAVTAGSLAAVAMAVGAAFVVAGDDARPSTLEDVSREEMARSDTGGATGPATDDDAEDAQRPVADPGS